MHKTSPPRLLEQMHQNNYGIGRSEQFARITAQRLVEGRVHDPAAAREDLGVLLLLVAAVLAPRPRAHKVRRDGEVDNSWCERCI